MDAKICDASACREFAKQVAFEIGGVAFAADLCEKHLREMRSIMRRAKVVPIFKPEPAEEEDPNS